MHLMMIKTMNTMTKRQTNDIRPMLATGGNHWFFSKSSTTQESTTWWTFRVTATGGSVCLQGGTTAQFSNPSRLLQRITEMSDLQGTQYQWWQIERQGNIRGKQASGEDQDTPLFKKNQLDMTRSNLMTDLVPARRGEERRRGLAIAVVAACARI